MGKTEKHKKKKDKMRSKQRKPEKRKEYSSSDGDSSSCEEWVETAVPQNAEKKTETKRDEWMDVSEFVPTVSNSELREQKRKARDGDRQLNTLDKPGQHERELNPYWKDGGRGVPSEEKNKPAASTVIVGDGGLNWLRKAYQRVTEQAAEEGRTEEEVAAERWGSLQNLKTMLQEAEEKAGYGKRTEYRRNYDRHGTGASYSSSRRSNDEQDHSYGRERTFQRPRDEVGSSDSERQQPRWQKNRDSSDTNSTKFHRPSEDDSNSSRLQGSRSSERTPRWQKNRDSPERSIMSLKFQRPNDDRERSNSNRQSSSHSSHRVPRWQKNKEMSFPDAHSRYDTTKDTDSTLDKSKGDSSIDRSQEREVSDHEMREPTRPVSGKDDKPQEPLSLTKKEMNDLGAKIIKAELLGNVELANKLKARLNSAIEISSDAKSTSSSNPQVVVLTQTNAQGLVSPLVCGATPSSSHQGRNKKQKLQTHQDGKRTCYFPDDAKYSLQQMFHREKLTTVDDETELYLKMSAGKERVKTDDDFTIDDAFLSKTKFESEEKQAERQKNRAIHEHKQMNSVMENCRYCLDNKQMQKHLIVAIGKKAYLSLPSCESLEEGHCYIVPMTHVPAVTHVDEDVWEEMQMFRQTLTGMFKSQEKDTVFMETSLHLRRHPHAFIECVPLSMELGCMAPMYFKKAILECDTEWAQNKRLVDLSKKNIRHSVPKGLPYFAVDFGLQGGFAHVVEDEKMFPDYFGHEILGGMLDVDPYMWRKPRKQNFKEQSEKVLAFEKWWKPFDCTST